MSQEIIAFGSTEIEKHKFHYHKNLILLEDADIDNILISNLIYSSEKNYT